MTNGRFNSRKIIAGNRATASQRQQRLVVFTRHRGPGSCIPMGLLLSVRQEGLIPLDEELETKEIHCGGRYHGTATGSPERDPGGLS